MAVNSSSYNTIRLSGLASGMDTDTIIQNLMNIEQMKVNRQLRSQIKMEWQQESYNNVATDLKDFRQTYMSVLSEKNVLSEGVFKKYDVTTNDTNGYVSVSANYNASPGSITIQHIEQLATNTKITSSGKVSASGELSATNATKLEYLDFGTSPGFNGGVVSFKINDVTFSFSKDDTLGDVISEINSSDAGVTLSYSRLTDKFTLAAKESGEGQDIMIYNISGNMLGAMGINQTNLEQGQNARMVIEGEYIEQSSNSFEVDGIYYTLQRAHGKLTMDSNGKPIVDEENFITATIKQDFDHTVDKMKEFVTGYNTMIEKLNGLLNEKADRDYFPLTDTEKDAMTEEQVEKWEEIAKTGILRNDAGIQSLLDSLRSAFFETVDGTGMSVASLGFSTGDWRENGKIEFNEDTFRAAMAKDADRVMRVFTNKSDSEDDTVARKENGLLHRLTSAIDTYTKNNVSKLDQLEKSITTQKKKISDMEDRMKDLEERYYAKYAAMEKALSNMQNQIDWIGSMMGTTSNS